MDEETTSKQTVATFENMNRISVLRHLANNVFRDSVEKDACAWAADEIERLRATLTRIHDAANQGFTQGKIFDDGQRPLIGLFGDIMQEAGSEIGR